MSYERQFPIYYPPEDTLGEPIGSVIVTSINEDYVIHGQVYNASITERIVKNGLLHEIRADRATKHAIEEAHFRASLLNGQPVSGS